MRARDLAVLCTLPYLPGNLTPVWELLADRIQHPFNQRPGAIAATGH